MACGLRYVLMDAAVIGSQACVAAQASQQFTRADFLEMRSEILILRERLERLSKKVEQSKGAATDRVGMRVLAANIPASALSPSAATKQTTVLPSRANASPGHTFLERKAGKTVTFYVPSGEIMAYGNFDVSLEGTTKGIGGLRGPSGAGPEGHVGWQPDISTNLSYLGVRGFEKIAGQPFNFVYQLETQIDISASSGTGETNSNQSNVVKGGLTTRNTYIGIEWPKVGALLIGKTDAPYKQSTARMNPFIGMVGDYGAIMGNTGGDNRVEFATRLDHSIWYESPEWAGFEFVGLFSPGQNRASNSDNIAAGESDCTGGNIPGSGGSLPIGCNDGAFSDAVSASLSYTHGPLYVVAAYERHRRVNRSSDLTGEYVSPPPQFFNSDTADEDAAKIGAQYTVPTHTTLSGIFEDMHRYVPSYLSFQNERQRIGTWLAATQHVTRRDSLSAGWAHAGRAPGDPGQHNTSLILSPFGQPGDAVGGAHANNVADLFTVALLHDLGEDYPPTLTGRSW